MRLILSAISISFLFASCAVSERISNQSEKLRAAAGEIAEKAGNIAGATYSVSELSARRIIKPAEIEMLKRLAITRVRVKKSPTSFGAMIYFDYRGGSFGVEIPEARSIETSSDLERDIAQMWKIRKTVDGKWASTNVALEAARRVFNTIELKGKTRNEVLERLGNPVLSKSSYKAPFFSAFEGAIVYRFDTGVEGLQVNVMFSSKDRVSRVERLNIE